ncbi:serine/threonineeeee-protein kinase RIM15 [Sporothrix schenckii 1099-18]|uniref:non-specific serine/threonine protein kinase n=1 Tax=Sporothrix schenckii 1099-18 TaxID=1397361 RepID=A0A0F2LTG9_SPOSC|nr:serine/threonineeeee-protein kinase RIM15 [Sporothrix schenckii 1099-18]KJR79820.1 serine/threonineeeee-protein kinase RIM15 [Sporothrix schenckii 1099-18]
MEQPDPDMLAPPAVTSLRDAAGSMQRSLSEDIREERDELREAAEQTLNVFMDLNLDGTIRWVSPSWVDVLGTPVDAMQGTAVADLVIGDNKDVFADVVKFMKKDDSRSQIVRFTMRLGALSKLLPADLSLGPSEDDNATDSPDTPADTIDLEAQGIMVYDTASGDESHTMWMIRPWMAPREIKINLPPLIVNSLGSGAEILASYLTQLAEHGLDDDKDHPPPQPVLCRICERQIPPWWFEKHTDLCLQEHTAEMDVQMAQESLTEHRHAIVKVLDALEARKSRSLTGDSSPLLMAEYKGLSIGPPLSSNSSSSATSSPSPAPGRSRDRSSGFGHARGRSFAIRRPQARIVELLLDLCDTAIEISTPAIKESSSSQAPGELRTQSPQSESRISQVTQWQSPSNNTLEQEQGLALLCSDTEKVAKAKVETVLRHRRVIEYAERIRVEFAVIVQDCIDGAMRKAARIAAGRLSDSTEDEEEDDVDQVPPVDGETEPHTFEEGFFAGSFDAPSTLAMALEKAQISDNPDDRRLSQATHSLKSGSPSECPTPKSNRGAIGIPSHRDSRRGSMLFEHDAGDSDGSLRSSSLASRPPPRTESPISEFGDLRRQASSRQHHRRSLIMAGTESPRRQESPSRAAGQAPSSPLRISKPRSIPLPVDGMASPEASPMLPTSEFGSPYMSTQHSFQQQAHHHQLHHHRRQSSISLSAAGDFSVRQAPSSPRLSAAIGAAPMARAVPPSIKDFEVIKPISKGAFGSVYLSKKKSTGEYFAIKVLKKADMVAKNQVTNVKAERAIMMWQGESDFVAKLYWTFSSKDYLYLVMEYLNGGDCASLTKVLGCLPEDWVKKYLGEVVLGVEHLHNRGIVHRDLKPDNLLIDQKGHLKLTDFGLSRMGLIGRQKRALNSTALEPVPDLLKQGPFARSASITSSRSASLDLHNLGAHSPGGTPQMTPSDSIGSFSQPSYFNLSNNLPHEARRVSGQRSDSGGSDALTNMISNLSLTDVSSANLPPAIHSPQNDATATEGSGSPDLPSLQATNTQTSSGPEQGKGTPPQSTMPPPNWALFDPEDTNRRFVGTPDYLAPETIKGEPQDETSDWWSVGCIMFEFLYGIPPFNAGEAEQVFENILARRIHWPDEMDDDVSPEAKDLINKLLCMDPHARLGANRDEKFASGGEEIRSHPWFEGVKWDTLLQDEAQFVPQLENIEDTEYFDARGATLQSFTEEIEDPSSSTSAPSTDYVDRPHDALSRVRSQANSMKRGLMPLHIPPHVRDLKSRRLSEPVVTDDFGSFAFKNLPVLEKANKDVIQKLRAEALAAQSKQPPAGGSSSGAGSSSTLASPSPVLEGSPVLPTPATATNPQIQRTLSNAKGTQRPQSPSGLSQANSSPSRVSQPSSPLLVSFHAAPDGRRKVSNGMSLLPPANTSAGMQHLPGNPLIEIPRVPPSLQKAATTVGVSSPVKGRGAPPPLPLSPQKALSTPRQSSNPTSRSRSLTVGSQEGSPVATEILSHRNRRSQVFDMSPSSSDNEGDKANAILLRVQRRRQSSRRMSQIAIDSGPVFRPLDVLICEDHPVSRMVMEKLLEKLRCRTISAASGPEAVRYAMSDIKFDIIFMEYKLPQISGADVARMIRDTTNTNSQTPIVAITAYLKELQARQHFDSLIEKPISSSKLTEVLASLCHWKPPAPNQASSPSLSLSHPAPSGLRQENGRLEDSPTSGSSIFPHRPGSSFRGSSRGDSIGSSLFGDSESMTTDDIPSIANRKAAGDWDDSGLGISQEEFLSSGAPKAAQAVPPASQPGAGPDSKPATLNTQSTDTSSEQTHVSVPVNLAMHSPVPVPLPQRSLEKLRAKREAIEKRRLDSNIDSADDEDDELGLGLISTITNASSGSSSSGGSGRQGPQPPSQLSSQQPPTGAARQHFRTKSMLPSSKLGIEMMRANSHDSVVLYAGSESAVTSASTSTAGPTTQVATPADTDTEGAGPAGGELSVLRTPVAQETHATQEAQEVQEEDEYDEMADTTVIHTSPDELTAASPGKDRDAAQSADATVAETKAAASARADSPNDSENFI